MKNLAAGRRHSLIPLCGVNEEYFTGYAKLKFSGS